MICDTEGAFWGCYGRSADFESQEKIGWEAMGSHKKECDEWNVTT